MKRLLPFIIIFIVVFIIYFVVGTNYTLHPKWALDYFNQMAQSILHFRLDISNPGTTYDLSYYGGKWYGPWGVIPALILIPIQLIRGQFIPTIYLSILFSSLNAVVMYFILLRIRNEFFPKLSMVGIYTCLIFFAFGTTQFYVGTLGSVWHVDQISTSFLGMVGVYSIFRKKRKFIHYFISTFCFSLAFLGRPTMALLNVLPVTLYIFDLQKRKVILLKDILILSLPFIFFLITFFSYNFVRFGNIFEYGFNHINNAQSGPFTFNNIPQNLWYMLFELPGINFANRNIFNFSLDGNSILFLSPPLLAMFLAIPIKRIKGKFVFNPHIASLWVTAIITMIPSWMHYGTGWMQLGYRYSLDVNILLVLLSIFGVKGKIGALYTLGTVFAVVMYLLGIRAFM